MGEFCVTEGRTTLGAAISGGLLAHPVVGATVEANETVDAGSHDDVDTDDEVEAESFPQDDSRLDSVSVDPVLPIDNVLPICIPIAIIGLVSDCHLCGIGGGIQGGAGGPPL